MAEKSYDADKKVKTDESISKGSQTSSTNRDRDIGSTDTDRFAKGGSADKSSQSMGSRSKE